MCCFYKGCNGTLKTEFIDFEMIDNGTFELNVKQVFECIECESNEKAFDKQQTKLEMFENVTKYNHKPKDVYNQSIAINPKQCLLFKNSYEIRHSLYRIANDKYFNLNLTGDILTIDKTLKESKEYSTYYNGAIEVSTNNYVLSWIHPYIYEILCQSNVTSVDGTFKICPPSFYQCCTVMATFSNFFFVFFFIFFLFVLKQVFIFIFFSKNGLLF